MDVLCNPFSIARKIKRPLILDGATGSLLQMQGVVPDPCLWMSNANLTDPQVVKEMHQSYVKAGADIITTNTFRTNPYALNRSTIREADIVKKSVEIALEAVEGTPILVAGSNSPAEDCYQVDRTISREILEENHFSHITNLFKSGAHFVLNETQSHWDEIEVICTICKNEDVPFVVSLYINEQLRLNSGEEINEAVELIQQYSPLAIGFNCIKPETFLRILSDINPDFNWGFYLNCCSYPGTDKVIKCSISPDEYIIYVKEALTNSPSFIGGCCGTGPEHIIKIKELFDERFSN